MSDNSDMESRHSKKLSSSMIMKIGEIDNEGQTSDAEDTDIEVESYEWNKDQYDSSEEERLNALSVAPTRKNDNNTKEYYGTDVKIRKVTLKKNKEKIERPKYTCEEKQCMASLVKIGGLEAWALWDSGSTTTGITPALAQLAKIRINELTESHILQLGTVGSRSTIKYGTNTELEIEGTKFPTYADIANFD